MIKQFMVLRFKRVKNEAKMVVIFKGVKIEVINGFKIQPSQEWSYNWVSRSNESIQMKLKKFSSRIQTSIEWTCRMELWSSNE